MKNLFGEEVDPLELLDNVRKGRPRYIPMQQIYGVKEGHKCKDCKHFVANESRSGKRWFKCALWYVSSSEVTDIRANGVACKKFKEKEVM